VGPRGPHQLGIDYWDRNATSSRGDSLVGPHHHVLKVGLGDMAIANGDNLKLFWFLRIVSIATILGLLKHFYGVALHLKQ
jgi:hypothetical protein